MREIPLLKINKKVEYALMALKYMAKKPTELTSAREICDEFKIPFDTISKVLQQLNNHFILKSIKGIHGGYLMDKDLAEINLLQIINIVENKLEMNSLCDSNSGPCELSLKCNIKGPLVKLQFLVNEYLMNLSLNKLFEENINLLSSNQLLNTSNSFEGNN